MNFTYQSLAPNTGGNSLSDGLHVVGILSPALVEAVYPYKALTRWHQLSHLPGLTGRWMDTGATALGGAVKGSYHRLAHGHHLIEDGVKVLRHPELKFGEFLHHLGLDSLTRRGIPNPLLPKLLVERLIDAGLPASTVSEWASMNVPKLLGGGLAVVLAGNDVVMAFSDAIPHTWWAVGKHFAFGALDTLFGVVTENPFMLLAAAGEFTAAGMTAWHVLTEPVLQAKSEWASWLIPSLGDSVGVGALLSGVGSLATGSSLSHTADVFASSTVAATAASHAKAAKVGLVLGLPVVGLAAGLAVRMALRSLEYRHEPMHYSQTHHHSQHPAQIVPMLALPFPKS
jgi:hypothetical protein